MRGYTAAIAHGAAFVLRNMSSNVVQYCIEGKMQAQNVMRVT